jgi:predicted TPR repeat methyltransferase
LLEGDPIEAAEALIASGRAGEAAHGLRERLAAGRGGALARITLVKALLAAGEVPQALAEAREAATLHPNVAPVLVMLGEALLVAQALPTAIAELQRALRQGPDDGRARRLLARAWLEAGEADKALEVLEGIEDAELLARATSIKSASRSDAGYVRHLFDQFAPDYDTRMREHLAYAAPEILFRLAAMVIPGREHLSVLDLGCGTGLAGEVFQPLAARLDGIDLSPAMLEKAQARNIYRTLAVADLEIALEKPEAFGLAPRYDLILAADTLVYLGDLATVFRCAAALLAPDGALLFTVEKAVDGFALGPKRRWRHSEAYLRRAAGEAGLAVAGLLAAAPRRESRQAVDGFAVALTP